MLNNEKAAGAEPLEIADADIYDAMKAMPGYLDITPGDFKTLYVKVYDQAVKRIVESVKAVDIMTSPVVTVTPQMTLQEAAAIMASREVSGVPVVEEDGHVVGVLSESDFIRRMGTEHNRSFMAVVARCLQVRSCAAIAIREKNVIDIMTAPALVVNEDMGVFDIAALLRSKQINRVPVVDGKQKLTGIVSREDIVHTSLIP